MQLADIILLGLASSTSAATTRVTVGDSGLVFTPDTVTAAIGDTVEFKFATANHDAVRGNPDTPCQPLGMVDGSFSSGMPQGDQINGVFQVQINSTDPILVFCSVGMHCGNGMVMAINPSVDKTAASFKEAASGKTSTSPGAVYGGTWTQ